MNNILLHIINITLVLSMCVFVLHKNNNLHNQTQALEQQRFEQTMYSLKSLEYGINELRGLNNANLQWFIDADFVWDDWNIK